MPERLGPRTPADPKQARDNRADLLRRLKRDDPATALLVERVEREAVPVRQRARSR